jgi:hypothetical protein
MLYVALLHSVEITLILYSIIQSLRSYKIISNATIKLEPGVGRAAGKKTKRRFRHTGRD